MAIEEILVPFVLLIVIAASVVFPLFYYHKTRFVPTWDNLHRCCAACEHIISSHPQVSLASVFINLLDDTPPRCHVKNCKCNFSRKRAFSNSLTAFELAARKELAGEK